MQHIDGSVSKELKTQYELLIDPRKAGKQSDQCLVLRYRFFGLRKNIVTQDSFSCDDVQSLLAFALRLALHTTT